ncbi:MAG: hypothetical protein KME10_00615 [Plectolyngbya sp. WJT66-NPBG17]|jgi:hypothetical protein|nr:hypothetical protein [Plectolyngbya sp. WJT66-NPBG17]MBW4523682.1 hypothetical protein [Phormidium tanganyikae FI6-MK23]
MYRSDVDPLESESIPSQFPKTLDIATVSVYGLAILSAGLFLFLPLVNLLHPSPWQRSLGLIHGIGAMLTTVIVAYTGHLAFPLLRGSAKILPQMRTLTFWSTVITALGIATGNLAYMRYRADIQYGGARAWLKENSPLMQYVFMEYHEFSVLFTLPLGVACTWILWKYGDSILEKQNRPVLTATCIGLMAMMFFAMGGFVTGLGIAKIRAL